jgi:hypothetical protein
LKRIVRGPGQNAFINTFAWQWTPPEEEVIQRHTRSGTSSVRRINISSLQICTISGLSDGRFFTKNI